jgi:CO/xanthine dehydrogenase Mo-binding subunit
MTQHLDGKIWYPSLLACHAALAAWISKRPVKLMFTREEDFIYSPKRNAAKMEMHSDLNDKGEILATKVSVELDLGDGEIFQDEILDQTCLGTLGLYRHRAVNINGIGLRTNIPPQGPMAGFGFSQGFFAAERHVSRIADTLGQDPAEWRKNNSLQENMGFAIGTAIKKPVPVAELIDTAATMCDYYRKWAAYELLRIRRRKEKRVFSEPRRGIGIAAAYQGIGFLNNYEIYSDNCEVEVTLEKDGSLEIKTSLASSETWHFGNWQNLALEILGVDPALVRITGNTGNAPDSGPGTMSRNIVTASKLVEECFTAIRKQRFRDPLPITVTHSNTPPKASGWVHDRSINPEALAHPSWGVVITEIEIEPVSLEPLFRGIWLVVDCGKLLDEKRACRILKTSVIHALGWACKEELRYVDGKIPLEYHRNYGIYSPEEMPQIELRLVTSDTTTCKGIGDLPFSCVPAAYAQAVSQAMDHHFENIPLGTQEIWEAWKENQKEYP